MNSPTLTRRDMLAATGIAVASGLTLPDFSHAQTNASKDLIFRTRDPRNAEPELAKLVKQWITPTEHFYVRSHAPNPQLDADEFRLQVEGLVRKPLSISLKELSEWEQRQVTATLTCAGNRRAEFNREGEVGGVQWQAGAIGNAQWQGALLAEVLRRAEVLDNARHVWFEGLDEIPKSGTTIPFGGSIPLAKAMVEDGPGAPLLAMRMNGAPLTRDHGYPLRTVVPGYIGARSVKWLGKIIVSDRPSPNHYVATAYKLVKKTDPIDWLEAGPIYRYPINAAIGTPERNASVSSGVVRVSGYVLPTGRPGSRVKEVLISSDQGKSWVPAQLGSDNADFCWQLWTADVRVTAATKRLTVKASDTSGGFMPGRVPWNAKGYLRNNWYQLPLRVS